MTKQIIVDILSEFFNVLCSTQLLKSSYTAYLICHVFCFNQISGIIHFYIY